MNAYNIATVLGLLTACIFFWLAWRPKLVSRQVWNGLRIGLDVFALAIVAWQFLPYKVMRADGLSNGAQFPPLSPSQAV